MSLADAATALSLLLTSWGIYLTRLQVSIAASYLGLDIVESLSAPCAH